MSRREPANDGSEMLAEQPWCSPRFQAWAAHVRFGGLAYSPLPSPCSRRSANLWCHLPYTVFASAASRIGCVTRWAHPARVTCRLILQRGMMGQWFVGLAIGHVLAAAYRSSRRVMKRPVVGCNRPTDAPTLVGGGHSH
jgi:hypothetical protein